MSKNSGLCFLSELWLPSSFPSSCSGYFYQYPPTNATLHFWWQVSAELSVRARLCHLRIFIRSKKVGKRGSSIQRIQRQAWYGIDKGTGCVTTAWMGWINLDKFWNVSSFTGINLSEPYFVVFKELFWCGWEENQMNTKSWPKKMNAGS